MAIKKSIGTVSKTVPTEKIKYINGRETNGVVYDMAKVKAEYEKLKCPPEFFNPCHLPFDKAKIFALMSMRSIGKTTNILLLGLIMYKLYGCQMVYIRQRDDDIAPKYSRKLWDTVLANDYIRKIFNGQWNSIEYRNRGWHLVNRDNNGDYIATDETDCMMMCAVNNAYTLKSTFNMPRGDFLIYDEFVAPYYYPGDFAGFLDLTATIIRDRQSPMWFMLSNTINKESQWFNELEIYDDVQRLGSGENTIVETELGTHIYIEWIGATETKRKRRSIINKLFYGFRSPEIASITGADWSSKNYQHIPEVDREDDEITTLYNKIYVYYNNKYIRLEIVDHPKLGTCIYVHWAHYVHDDSIILTAYDITDPRYIHGLGNGTLAQFIRMMLTRKKVYYASNDVGSFFDSYVKYISKIDIVS